jgi:hypothetical protein
MESRLRDSCPFNEGSFLRPNGMRKALILPTASK